ncbi:hypothetical protein BN1708_014041, partial [Verticillium longisporum]
MIRGFRPRVAILAAVAILFSLILVLLVLQDRETGYLYALVPPDLGSQRQHGNDWAGADANSITDTDDVNTTHPIDELIEEAQLRHRQLLGKQSLTLRQAASRYRERRGRHPPPGFDVWFAAAMASKAVIVEEFFDRIHHDINPFWAVDPAEMRRHAARQAFMIRVRGGKTATDTEGEEPPYRVRQWAKLVAEMEPHIPDLDMFVNVMDESRVLVPWDTMRGYMAKEQQGRRLVPVDEAVSEYSGVGDAASVQHRHDPHWISDEVTRYWDHLRVACPPDSPGRNVTALPSFDVPVAYPAAAPEAYTYKGYVRNATAARDPCLQPHLRGLHGTFIESISMSTTHELLPVFAESKLPQNNAMLVPGAVYLDDERVMYSGGAARGGPWHRKRNALIWRGVSSGARNKRHNWWHIHRFRFVQMLNGTTVAAAEAGDAARANTFALPPPPPGDEMNVYDVAAQRAGRLGAWLRSFADVAFTDILCDPPDMYTHWWKGPLRKKICTMVEPYYAVADELPMKKMYNHKYLPDIDGNSFSGRYRAFLLSSSMPLKSTIYAEWHDDRLVPWVHFVPFDNTYVDLYGIMDYFLRGRDAAAEGIAADGKRWAETVLRREDMRLYVWRLLLEYARVMDDNRDRLAFVQDWID